MTDDAKPIQWTDGSGTWFKLFTRTWTERQRQGLRALRRQGLFCAGRGYQKAATDAEHDAAISALESANGRIAELEADVELRKSLVSDWGDVANWLLTCGWHLPSFVHARIGKLKAHMLKMSDQALRAKPSPAGEKEPSERCPHCSHYLSSHADGFCKLCECGGYVAQVQRQAMAHKPATPPAPVEQGGIQQKDSDQHRGKPVEDNPVPEPSASIEGATTPSNPTGTAAGYVTTSRDDPDRNCVVGPDAGRATSPPAPVEQPKPTGEVPLTNDDIELSTVHAVLSYWRHAAELVTADDDVWSQARRYLAAAGAMLGDSATREGYIARCDCALDICAMGQLGPAQLSPLLDGEVRRLDKRIDELERIAKGGAR